LCLVFGLLVTVGAGCSGSGSDGGFCDSAANVLNYNHFRDRYSSDGRLLVAALRTIDLTDLADTDRQVFTSAITEVEAAVAASGSGTSHDGWTTRPVAAIATRVCAREIPVIRVMS